jgi:hypothetical protein
MWSHEIRYQKELPIQLDFMLKLHWEELSTTPIKQKAQIAAMGIKVSLQLNPKCKETTYHE